jgi:hypothetical protein
MRRIWSALVPLALVLLAGCPSLSTMQTPSTVPKNQVRFGFGLEGVGYSETSGSVTAPQMELSARYGVTDEIDVGGKLYFLGAEVGAKYQAVRGQVDVAIAPALSYISISATASDGSDSKFSVAYLHLPILIGLNVNDRLTLGFGPKLMYVLASGSASSGMEASSVTSDGIMTGGYGQIAFRVGDAFWLAPEINVYKPFTENAKGVVYQGGLMFLFGGAPARHDPAPMGQPMGPMPAPPPPMPPPPPPPLDPVPPPPVQ